MRQASGGSAHRCHPKLQRKFVAIECNFTMLHVNFGPRVTVSWTGNALLQFYTILHQASLRHSAQTIKKAFHPFTCNTCIGYFPSERARPSPCLRPRSLALLRRCIGRKARSKAAAAANLGNAVACIAHSCLGIDSRPAMARPSSENPSAPQLSLSSCSTRSPTAALTCTVSFVSSCHIVVCSPYFGDMSRVEAETILAQQAAMSSPQLPFLLRYGAIRLCDDSLAVPSMLLTDCASPRTTAASLGASTS